VHFAQVADAIRAGVGRRLEQGAPSGWAARAAATGWEAWSRRNIARPLRLPTGVRVVGIGGAVLGGAGKTPVAIALVRALSSRDERPVLVGHAYRATPGRARVVRPDDVVQEVGDDALAAARLLDGIAPVIVAPTRQAAVDCAARLGHGLLVVDGLLQSSPRPLGASVLVLDSADPWGAGACPPLGDLRAPREALLCASDLVAVLRPEGARVDPAVPAGALELPSRTASARSVTGDAVGLQELRDRRVGLLMAVARPARIVAALERAGLVPAITVALGAHAIFPAGVPARAAGAGVDVWLTTARCATKLPPAICGCRVLALDHDVDVRALVARIATRAGE
jgi:tetraacyldisaccharide 4'-kinase